MRIRQTFCHLAFGLLAGGRHACDFLEASGLFVFDGPDARGHAGDFSIQASSLAINFSGQVVALIAGIFLCVAQLVQVGRELLVTRQFLGMILFGSFGRVTGLLPGVAGDGGTLSQRFDLGTGFVDAAFSLGHLGAIGGFRCLKFLLAFGQLRFER